MILKSLPAWCIPSLIPYCYYHGSVFITCNITMKIVPTGLTAFNLWSIHLFFIFTKCVSDYVISTANKSLLSSHLFLPFFKTYIYIPTYMCVCIYVCVCVCMYMYKYVHTCIYVCVSCINIYIYMYTECVLVNV